MTAAPAPERPPYTEKCHRSVLWVAGRGLTVCTHPEHFWQLAPLRGTR